jgi:hypothetical protein
MYFHIFVGFFGGLLVLLCFSLLKKFSKRKICFMVLLLLPLPLLVFNFEYFLPRLLVIWGIAISISWGVYIFCKFFLNVFLSGNIQNFRGWYFALALFTFTTGCTLSLVSFYSFSHYRITDSVWGFSIFLCGTVIFLDLLILEARKRYFEQQDIPLLKNEFSSHMEN